MSDQHAGTSGTSGRPEDDRERREPRRPAEEPLEEDPVVEEAFADDTTATPLATEDRDDRGPLAPSFREPGEPSGEGGRDASPD
ncbi:MAG TPA: hypothetical protein VE546_16315 [Streptomyces sp.]|uniref:hypothetical protein n=1 Tax=Streptomyces sp. TaxID=1931 RepID=UPI002D2C2C29|nr:hypothetical protein [Streptomyces sp.]HZG05108.1 hypothetical protein [Streptomyces sp.]